MTLGCVLTISFIQLPWLLICALEENIAESHEYKLDKYSSLKVEYECNGWLCYNVAVELSARGQLVECLIKAASLIGMRQVL